LGQLVEQLVVAVEPDRLGQLAAVGLAEHRPEWWTLAVAESNPE